MFQWSTGMILSCMTYAAPTPSELNQMYRRVSITCARRTGLNIQHERLSTVHAVFLRYLQIDLKRCLRISSLPECNGICHRLII